MTIGTLIRAFETHIHHNWLWLRLHDRFRMYFSAHLLGTREPYVNVTRRTIFPVGRFASHVSGHAGRGLVFVRELAIVVALHMAEHVFPLLPGQAGLRNCCVWLSREHRSAHRFQTGSTSGGICIPVIVFVIFVCHRPIFTGGSEVCASAAPKNPSIVIENNIRFRISTLPLLLRLSLNRAVPVSSRRSQL